MADDDSLKQLLERLCSLQEQHLTLLRDSIERRERFDERQEKLQQAWERQMSLYEAGQKAYDQRAERHEKGVRVRGALTLIVLGLIVVAIIVAHFL